MAARIGAGAIPVGGRREEAAFLAPLPLALLPAEPGVHERLRVLGLETMGQLAALDHSAVVARFGPAGAEMQVVAHGTRNYDLELGRYGYGLHDGTSIDMNGYDHNAIDRACQSLGVNTGPPVSLSCGKGCAGRGGCGILPPFLDPGSSVG